MAQLGNVAKMSFHQSVLSTDQQCSGIFTAFISRKLQRVYVLVALARPAETSDMLETRPYAQLQIRATQLKQIDSLTSILHRGLRNCFFFFLFRNSFTFSNFFYDFYFPFSIWTCISIFMLYIKLCLQQNIALFWACDLKCIILRIISCGLNIIMQAEPTL